MEPIKIKILKRSWNDEEANTKIPLKKRIRQRVEKENKTNEFLNSPPSNHSKRGSKILENSTVPDTISNAKMLGKEEDHSEDEVDSVFNETLLQLQKSGIKIAESNINSTKTSSDKKKKSSSRKKHIECVNLNSSQNKCKRGLLKEFDLKDCSAVIEQKSMNMEKKVPELEKLPEDLILNYKRTPQKVARFESLETPKRTERETPIRRSSRRRSSILNEAVLPGSEETPKKSKNHDNQSSQNTPFSRSNKTPKISSVKKSNGDKPKTPVTKIKRNLPTTPLEKARLSLHVSTVPKRLPCREKEYENILTFLQNKLWDCIGGCMYISGVPGTGKTATVSQVIMHLQECAKEGTVPEFKYIEINGMRLSNPRQAYVQLWQKLFDRKDKITPDRAQRLLDEWFSKSDRQNSRRTTVLLVDELDLICTKKQDVVYNLLDWPTRTHSRLVVLTIANTMDMPERLFKGRVTSRMGLTRLTFMPYTHKQLEEIVLARLNGLNAFVTDAVRLVTRKVAAVSGDARRALDICRRATELPPQDETVKISHIEQAIKEMTNSNIVKIIRNCGEMEKLFLRSLSDVSSRSNVEEVDLREVIDQLYAICVLEGVGRPSISSVLTVSNRLKCCRLIFSNQSSAGILQRLTLNVTQDDIHYALRCS